MQRRAGEDAGRELARQHVLLLPTGSSAVDVEALVRTRHPEAEETEDGALRLGRHLRLTGPLALDAVAVATAVLPPGYALTYALESPVERGDPPYPGTSHPDGLHRAFPDGFPVRAEHRGVDLLVSLARRLGGVVRVHGSGVLLRPDHETRIDVLVHAPYWLEPGTVHDVIARQHPQARLAIEGEEWMGPSRDDADPPTPDPPSPDLPDDLRTALHAQADRFDAEAMAQQPVLDAYAVVLDIGQDARGGIVEVLVHVADETPPALAGVDWAERAVTYEVRWTPYDPAEAEQEHPDDALVASRRRAAALVLSVARLLIEATDGVPVDADGFLLDRYGL